MCDLHPKYRAQRRPRAACLQCFREYFVTHPDLNPKVFVRNDGTLYVLVQELMAHPSFRTMLDQVSQLFKEESGVKLDIQ